MAQCMLRMSLERTAGYMYRQSVKGLRRHPSECLPVHSTNYFRNKDRSSTIHFASNPAGELRNTASHVSQIRLSPPAGASVVARATFGGSSSAAWPVLTTQCLRRPVVQLPAARLPSATCGGGLPISPLAQMADEQNGCRMDTPKLERATYARIYSQYDD